MNKLEMYDDTKLNVERVSIIEQWFKDHKSLPEKIGEILQSFIKFCEILEMI